MSLYIGNLSAHTRGDDLKHVFWRFGRCNLRLKDRFGFVEYDFVQDAKKALRALQGRKICGEPLTLTWSRIQPKPFHGNPRGVSSYELQHERRMNENDCRDYELDNEQPDSDGRRLNSVNMRDDDRGDHQGQGDIQDYNGDRHDFREGLPDDIGGAVPKLVDTGRWGEQVHDPSYANGVEFDRYEPHQDHDRKYEDENCRMAYSGGGFAPRSSQENVRIERMNYTTLNHSSDMRSTCFSCGASGHKIRNCPRKYSSGRKLTRFDNRQDDAAFERSRGEAELERMGSRSVGEMQLTEGTASRHMNGGMASGSGKHKMVTDNVSSPTGNENNITEIKDHEGKKRSRREGESPKRHGGKKARRSVSSSPHSRYAASRLRSCSTSQSSKSVTRSGSQSRSNSASRGEHHSVSSDSRLLSTSKSSRSRSSSSISLSVSLSPSPFSSNKAHTNLKASAGTPKSKEIQVQQRQPVEGDACIEKADDENTMDAIKSSHAVSSFEAEDDTKNDHPLQMNGDGENHTMSRSIHEVTNPGTPLPEIGSHTTGSLSPEGLSDVQDHQNSNALVIGHVPSQSKEPASETPIYRTTGCSTSISSEELCMVLKHYGLELPEESERHLPMEGYFGSARLWPWEVINYRRVKKGLISVENYARRVAQNQEFGIVDKYIRSSSGWGEIGVDNP